MILLCDESVRLPILLRLAADGHELRTMRDIAPGAPDETVLGTAREMGIPVITMDVGFGDLVFRDHLAVPGVLLLRLHGLSWDEKADVASRVLAAVEGQLMGSFIVANATSVRIRPLPGQQD